MIDLYYSATPNGLKLTLFLEEAGLPYRIIPVRLGKGDFGILNRGCWPGGGGGCARLA